MPQSKSTCWARSMSRIESRADCEIADRRTINFILNINGFWNQTMVGDPECLMASQTAGEVARGGERVESRYI